MKLRMTIVAKTGRLMEMSEIHIRLNFANTGLTFDALGDVLPGVGHDLRRRR